LGLEISEYWKLADQLSIHDASCLIIGVDPEKTRELFSWGEDYDLEHLKFSSSPNGYEATKKSILGALRSKAIDGYYHFDNDINGNSWPVIEESYVTVTSLKQWLSDKGFNSGFFFDAENGSPAYLDKHHPHYSPKLAASISAWQAVSDNPTYKNNGKTIKQNLINWLTSHAAEFDLIKDDGEINNNAIENQVAMVSNWDVSGGAPKTPTLVNSN
jgi:hypothetical protein